MAEATFYHGSPLMVDHTPSAAVTAGDVVVIGTNVRIAHKDIAANALGALAFGYGVYKIAKGVTTGDGWSDGDEIYWDDTANVATTDSTDDAFIGFAVGDAADADATGVVAHLPITVGAQS